MRCVFVYMVLVMFCVCVARLAYRFNYGLFSSFGVNMFSVELEQVLTHARAPSTSGVVQYAAKEPVADVNGCLMQVQIHFTHTHAHAQIRSVSLYHFPFGSANKTIVSGTVPTVSSVNKITHAKCHNKLPHKIFMM